jgi:hypothetical protein
MAALTESPGRRSAAAPRRFRPQIEALEDRRLLSAAPTIAPDPVNLAYVTQAYQDVLGRTPDPSGLAAWTGQLEGLLTHAQFASALTHSAEYYSNLVTADYQKFLGRTPDPASLAGWTNALQHGLRDEQFEAALAGSPEYLADHGGPGAAWVQALYQDVLGRTPSSLEVNAWLGALAGGVTPNQVATIFTTSAEHENDRVIADYQQYLGRSPEPGVVLPLATALQNGLNNEDLVAAFVSSDEYFHGRAAPQFVNLTGFLHTGVTAPGGETTGTVIDTNQGTFELDLRTDPALANQVNQLNGQAVVVTGDQVTVTGVEVAQRKIVFVDSLEAAVPTQVTVKGTLHTGVVVIGGETTGTTIDTNQGTFELDLGNNPTLIAQADQLNGKAAIVTGTLTIHPGTEVPVREIITVSSLEAYP